MDSQKLQFLLQEIEKQYLADDRPWIIGLSGGKDSTAVTQLVYTMLMRLSPAKRNKKIWVISSDTLVDTPIADKRRNDVCSAIQDQAKRDGLPIEVVVIRPPLTDTFWVNLIGRGYPSPNRWFRWCTDRLKIRPMNTFVTEKVRENGEVIIVLGIRTSESQNRGRTIEKYNIEGTKFSQHNDIKGALIYAPITDWLESDVWDYLMTIPSPWGDDRKFLLQCYSKGEEDIEFIIDKDQKASGASRLGCWVCTVVPQDWSIMAYIEEGETWLTPLKELRDYLTKIRDDKEYREMWRKDEKRQKIYSDILGKEYEGHVRFGHKVYGPFTFKTRHEILKRVIKLQTEESDLKRKLEEYGVNLISPEEVEAIIKLWIYDGDNIDDINNTLRECGAGEAYIKNLFNQENGSYKDELTSICRIHAVPPDLVDKMLFIEHDLSGLSRRHGIYNRLENVIEHYVLEDMKKSGENI